MGPYPTGLKLIDPQHLQIDWSDGQVRTYPLRELRENCPCASCRERRGGSEPAPQNPLQLNILSPAEARPLGVVSMRPVGNYAYTIVFSDGHDSGIFTFELLCELGTTAE